MINYGYNPEQSSSYFNPIEGHSACGGFQFNYSITVAERSKLKMLMSNNRVKQIFQDSLIFQGRTGANQAEFA